MIASFVFLKQFGARSRWTVGVLLTFPIGITQIA
jgi:hypothetical protein